LGHQTNGRDLGPYGLKSFAKHGVTAVLQGGAPPLHLAASNLSYVPYASSFRKSSHTVTAMLDKNGVMKDGCIHDPRVMQEWVQSTTGLASTIRFVSSMSLATAEQCCSIFPPPTPRSNRLLKAY
jgi:hypothetical protein